MMNQKTKINCKEGAFYQTLGTRIFGFLFVCSFVLISTACSSGAAGTSIDSGEDTDKDGIADSMDSCPNDANEGIDTDGDGIDDVCDRDDDNDEVFDNEDNCPKIPNPIGPDETTQRDTDGDEIGDECDDDSSTEPTPPQGCSDEEVAHCTLTTAEEGDSQTGTCTSGSGNCTYECKAIGWMEVLNSCVPPKAGCIDEVVDDCTLTTADDGVSQDGTCPDGYAGSCNYTCEDGQWVEPSTGLDNSCTPRCIDEVVDNCTLTNADEGDSQAGNCPDGYAGSCNYTCENGQWVEPSTGLDNSCNPPQEGCSDEVVAHCTLTNADEGDSQAGTCPDGYTGSCNYTCENGQWEEPSTGLDNTCTPRCIDEVVDNCTLTTADEGDSQAGTCPDGYTGSCNYTCENGQWEEPSTGLDNSCNPPQEGCSDEVVAHCTLTTAVEGVSQAGTCPDGYTGSCNYTCKDGQWVEPTTGLDNSCTPRCIDEVVNNCTLTAADDGVSQAGTCPDGYAGSCNYTCEDGQWVAPTAGLDNSCTPRCIDEVVDNCTLTAAVDGDSQAGTCPTGYAGSCNYTCENGQWEEPSTGLDNTCTPECSNEVVDNCTLTTAVEGVSQAGTCSDGYTGSCAYDCKATGWTEVVNSCIPTDTDNDGIDDFADTCLQSPNGFISDKGPRSDGQQSNDYDNDGCQDATEDFDDDNDKIDDVDDLCQLSANLGFLSDKGPRSDGQQSNDYDSDGCEDTTEDIDDDGDGLIEIGDGIRTGVSAEDMLKNIRWNLAGTSYDDEEEDTGDDSGCPSDACNGYELMHDITLSTNWEPVGTETTPFTGNFDGNGNTIRNFNIDIRLQYTGFFGYLKATTVKPVLVQNLRLSGTSVQSSYSGDEYIAIGVLAGALTRGDEATGGFVIDNVSSLGISVIGGSNGNAIGGLVGGILGGIIQNSYSTGDVNAPALTDDEGGVGGLVGINFGGTIRNSYATGDVNGGPDDDIIGGLVGINSSSYDDVNGVVQNSYATGNVNGGAGSDYVGGLIGLNDDNTLVEYCYATKSAKLIGSIGSNHTIRYNYRINGSDTDNSVTTIRKITDGMLKALTSTQTKTDFGTAEGWKAKNWDFTDTSKYPTLKSYKEDGNNAQIEGVLLCGQGTNFVQCDSDGDGIDDAQDIDDDGDGLIEIGDEIRAGVSAEEMLNNIRNDLSGASYTDDEANVVVNGCPSDGCKGYELMHDITLAANWVPVGDWRTTTPFTGNFNGNGNTIRNFNIDTSLRFTGFFGYLKATRSKPVLVQSLRLSGTSVQSSDTSTYIGVLAGITTPYVTINNVSSLGISVTGGGNRIGGLVGVSNGIIQNSYATGNVASRGHGSSDYVGGLVGNNAGGTIRNSYATGNVNGSNYVGGLVGWNSSYGELNGVVQNSYATGMPNGGGDSVGGLIGLSDDNTLVEYCYATKSAKLIGSIGSNHTIRYNYRINGSDTGDSVRTVRKITDGMLKALTSTQTKTDFGTAGGWKTKNWDFTDTSKYPTLKLYKEDGNNAQIEGVLLCGQGTNFVQCASQ